MATFLGTTAFKTQEISNNLTALSAQSFAFELSYTPGTAQTAGYTWTLQALPPIQGTPPISAVPFTQTFTTADGLQGSTLRKATASFNTIQLLATATSSGGSLSVSGLSFTVNPAAAVVCGQLVNMNAASPGTTSINQWLVADGDLSFVAWSLSGVVRGVRLTGEPNDSVKLDIYTKNFSPTPQITTCGASPCP